MREVAGSHGRVRVGALSVEPTETTIKEVTLSQGNDSWMRAELQTIMALNNIKVDGSKYKQMTVKQVTRRQSCDNQFVITQSTSM